MALSKDEVRIVIAPWTGTAWLLHAFLNFASRARLRGGHSGARRGMAMSLEAATSANGAEAGMDDSGRDANGE